ncbi:hypothetical protein BST61_g6735 [Cercospora zeina]
MASDSVLLSDEVISIVPVQGIGDVNAQGNGPHEKYMRSWHYAAGRLNSGGVLQDVIVDLYNRTQQIVSEHNVYLQFPGLAGEDDANDYFNKLLTSVRQLEDGCWRRNWENSADHVRDLGWNRAADAIAALGSSVVVNGRYTRDITTLDKCNALYSDVEHRLSIRNVDNRTLDRYRGQKERLMSDLTNHGTFVMPPNFPAAMSAEQFCEALMTDINQSRINRVKPTWDEGIAALQSRFETMTEFVTANYDPYLPDQQFPGGGDEPQRRLGTYIPFDDAHQTVFSLIGYGQWFMMGCFGAGVSANVMLWNKINAWHRVVDRVAAKELYLEPRNQWLSPDYWEVPICDRIPREYALAKSLNDLDVENVVRHRDYGLFERSVMFRLYLEVCRFGNLNEVIGAHSTANQPISTRAIWSIFEALATVLVFMERGNTPGGASPPQHKSQYHRDIKPDNIFLAAPNDKAWPQIPTAKLGDFGLGIWSTDPKAGLPGVGTLVYMPPEAHECGQPDGQKTVGRHQNYHTVTMKSDVWSVGRVIMALMSLEYQNGLMPFFRCSDQEPSFNQQCQAQYPLDLQKLVLRCLRRDPAQRPTPSGLWTEMQTAIQRWKGARPSNQGPQFMNFARQIYTDMAL